MNGESSLLASVGAVAVIQEGALLVLPQASYNHLFTK